MGGGNAGSGSMGNGSMGGGASAGGNAAGMDRSKMEGMQPGAKGNATAMTFGEIKKIDLKAQTITLKHGPIPNIDMPAMTMVFKAKSPALLDKLKVGEKVKFSAEMPDGALVVTAIKPAN